MYIKIMSIMKKILALLGVVLVVASCSKDTDTKVEMASGEGAMRLGLAMPADI
jgi:PBP1b-binding outer membrane lipoprotein LpoB